MGKGTSYGKLNRYARDEITRLIDKYTNGNQIIDKTTLAIERTNNEFH